MFWQIVIWGAVIYVGIIIILHIIGSIGLIIEGYKEEGLKGVLLGIFGTFMFNVFALARFAFTILILMILAHVCYGGEEAVQPTDTKGEQIRALVRSIDYSVVAFRELTEKRDGLSTNDGLSKEDWGVFISRIDSCLELSLGVSSELLNEIHPELREAYRDGLIYGLHAYKYGLLNRNEDSTNIGATLVYEAAEWFESNYELLDSLIDVASQ